MCVDKNIRMRQENIRFPNVSTSLAYDSNKIVRKFANKEKKIFSSICCLFIDEQKEKEKFYGSFLLWTFLCSILEMYIIYIIK